MIRYDTLRYDKEGSLSSSEMSSHATLSIYTYIYLYMCVCLELLKIIIFFMVDVEGERASVGVLGVRIFL